MAMSTPPGVCACGTAVKYRVPVDRAIADVYGYNETGGTIDMCQTCFSDVLQSGDVARVLADVEPLTDGAVAFLMTAR